MSRKAAAKALLEAKKKGRCGDIDIVHVNPKEKAALKAMGGAGTVNPETGLEEYFNLFDEIEEGWEKTKEVAGDVRDWAFGKVEEPTDMSEEDRALKESSAAREKELYERQVAGYERLEDVYQLGPEQARQQAEFSAEEAQRAQSEVLAAQVGGGLRGGGAAAGARAAAAQAAIDSAGIRQRGIESGQKAQLQAAEAQVEAAAALERMGTPAQRQEASMADARLEVAQVIERNTDYGMLDEEDAATELLQMAADAVDPKVAEFYTKEAKRIEESSWL